MKRTLLEALTSLITILVVSGSIQSNLLSFVQTRLGEPTSLYSWQQKCLSSPYSRTCDQVYNDGTKNGVSQMDCKWGRYSCCTEVSIENRKYYDCGYSYCWSRSCAPVPFKENTVIKQKYYDCFMSSWSQNSPSDGGCSGAYWTEKKQEEQRLQKA